MSRYPHSQKGLTLVELLVSLVIGLVVTGVVTQVFIANRTTFQVQESMSRVQESGRFALQFLGNTIREAGSGLEMNIGVPVTVCNVDDDTCNEYLSGLGTQGISGRVDTQGALAVKGSDIIDISSTDGCNAKITDRYNANSAQFKASEFCPSMRKDAILMVVGFDRRVILSVNNTPSAGGNVTINHSGKANINHKLTDLEPGSRIVGFSSFSYFVRDTGQVDAAGNPIRALARRNNLSATAVAEDIIDGVEDMRVFYGIPNGNRIDYRRADAINANEWPLVRSARVELLMVSDQAAPGAENQVVNFGGAAVTADGRLREVYTTVAALRQRVN